MMNSPPKSVPRIYVGTLFGGYSARQRLQSDKRDTLISPGCIGDFRRSKRGGGKPLIRKHFCCLNVKMILFSNQIEPDFIKVSVLRVSFKTMKSYLLKIKS